MVDDLLRLDPDRALPAEPALRSVARSIYDSVKTLPLVSMHGHVPVETFRDDTSFGDAAELFVIPDHYVRRMLVSQGMTNAELGVRRRGGSAGEGAEADHREIWRRLCANWRLFRGTPTRYWLEHELVEVFGITRRPDSSNADDIFDQVAEALARPEFRPRRLFERFHLELLSTTDPATSDLAAHARLASEGWGERIVPTFRPDALFFPDREQWRAGIRTLSRVSGIDVSDYGSFLEALRQRRFAFAAAGARASDHGHRSADTTPLDTSDARQIFAHALKGPIAPETAEAFAANMLFETARMSLDDGLVMQLHPGVARDYSTEIWRRYGPDQGFDIPERTDYTRSLRPLLEQFGLEPRFRLILFTVDEAAYSRELAPLAGAFPSVRLGVPWWFLDSPNGMARFRALITETAGFYNTSGFVDDTRAFCSIPARHDLARRIDAGYLARLVCEGYLDRDEAVETAYDLHRTLPLAAYERRAVAR
jgi:glucuronate isomerase